MMLPLMPRTPPALWGLVETGRLGDGGISGALDEYLTGNESKPHYKSILPGSKVGWASQGSDEGRVIPSQERVWAQKPGLVSRFWDLDLQASAR